MVRNSQSSTVFFAFHSHSPFGLLALLRSYSFASLLAVVTMRPHAKPIKALVKRSLLESLIDVDPVIKQEPPQKRPRSASVTAVPRRAATVTLDIMSSSSSSSDDEDAKRETMDRLVGQLVQAPALNPSSPPRLRRRSKHIARIIRPATVLPVQLLAAAKDEFEALVERSIETLSMMRYVSGRINPTNPRGDVLGLSAANGLRLFVSLSQKVIEDSRAIQCTMRRLAKHYSNRYDLRYIYASDDDDANSSD